MGKRRMGKYPRAFRERAVERMKVCDSIQELARELGVHRSVLYQWRDQLAPLERAEWQTAEAREAPLERENRLLKQALAEKTLEVDFFKGALQKVAARRQGNSATGETAFGTKSGN